MAPVGTSNAAAEGFDEASAVSAPVDDLIYDVGLHRGEDTAFYLALGYRVVAFEADPENARHCRDRFASEIADGRLTIVDGAIAPPGTDSITFYRSSRLSMWGTTDAEWASRRDEMADFEEVTVPTTDFREQIDLHGMPHYLKIDIEGADRHCLEVVGDLDARPRFVSIESEKFSWEELIAEFDLLESLGYRRFAVVQQANIPGRMIRTSDRHGRHLEHRFERDASGAFGGDVAPWLTREAALERYEKVFRDYRRFGEDSWIRRRRLGRAALSRLPRYTGRSYPGWYDTHAMHTG